ncbi:MAG TPA: hypothetical protein VHO25_06060, partial [Polyangiaceae bacterium]|nr:hypothetical protein [Polyangiaceae bacterium]
MKRASMLGLAALCLLPSCAPEFDPASELNSLRMLAVQKDKPYARPGEDVRLQLLWHDGTDEPSREIQIQWLAGCYNPPGDLFAGCFAENALGGSVGTAQVVAEQVANDAAADATLSADAGVAAQASDAGVVAPGDAGSDAGEPIAGAPTLSIPYEERVLGGGDFQIKTGYGEFFSFRMPTEIVSSRPHSANDPSPPYGLAYVFVAICAGELRLEPSPGGFPLACYENGQRRDSRDFVAGYSAVYAYADPAISNANPSVSDFEINGKDVEIDCIGEDCSGLIAPASAEPGDCTPENTLKFCADEKNCDPIAIKPVIDQSQPAENDAVLSRIRGGGEFAEQMWINYYA